MSDEKLMLPGVVADTTTPLVSEEVLDGLMSRAEAEGAEPLDPDGLLPHVTKAVLERALAEELSDHLGFDRRDPAGWG